MEKTLGTMLRRSLGTTHTGSEPSDSCSVCVLRSSSCVPPTDPGTGQATPWAGSAVARTALRASTRRVDVGADEQIFGFVGGVVG